MASRNKRFAVRYVVCTRTTYQDQERVLFIDLDGQWTDEERHAFLFPSRRAAEERRMAHDCRTYVDTTIQWR